MESYNPKVKPQITFTTYNLQGRDELIRLILYAGDMNFTDRLLTSEEFQQNHKNPNGQLAILEANGQVMRKIYEIEIFCAELSLQLNDLSTYEKAIECKFLSVYDSFYQELKECFG